MNEACRNLFGAECDLTTKEGQEFAVRVLNYMRDVIKDIQDETGNYYNLEATPAEGTSYRLARRDKETYPDIITAGEKVPYYTNSSQLPVGFTDDIFETLDLQDELQSLYTGGTVLHLYLGEEIHDTAVAKRLLQKVFLSFPDADLLDLQQSRLHFRRTFRMSGMRRKNRGLEPRGRLSASGSELQHRQERGVCAARQICC